MSVNYYVAENFCECCQRHDQLHIGKASYGWSFSFRGYPDRELKSWQAWKQYLRTRVIVNEYGERVPYEWFVDHVEGVKSPAYVLANGIKNLHHNHEAKRSHPEWLDPKLDWNDQENYAFSSRDFS